MMSPPLEAVVVADKPTGVPEVAALDKEQVVVVETATPIQQAPVPANGTVSGAEATTTTAAAQTPSTDTPKDDALASDAGKTEASDGKDSPEGTGADKSSPLKVSVGEYNYEDFKNRGEEGYHVIELLIGSDNLPEEVNRENFRRSDMASAMGRRRDFKPKDGSSSETWVQRIRIHSPIILQYLSEVMRPPSWKTKGPRVFFRPFKCLMHYHPRMREALAELEKQVGEEQRGELSPTAESKGINVLHHDNGDVGSKTAGTQADATGHENNWDRAAALNHLRCYVDFMDKRIIPLQDMFKKADQRMVRFNDLWYLFNVPDYIYAPAGPSTRDSAGSRRVNGRYQTAFHLYCKTLSVVNDGEPDDFRVKDNLLELECYYIDHDGGSYGPVKQSFGIDAYDGYRDIRDLAVYPMRFADGHESIRAQLRAQGKLFRRFVQAKRVSCKGWTVTGPPVGANDGDGQSSPDYIDSEVIIDLDETIRRKPEWKPKFWLAHRHEVFSEFWQSGEDDMPIRHWPGPNDQENTSNGNNSNQSPDKNAITNNTKLNDSMNNNISNNTGSQPLCSIHEATQLDDDTEARLRRHQHSSPWAYFVYVLRQRRFAMVDVFSLEELLPQGTIFNDLRIDESHRIIVQSLVADHFEKRQLQRQKPGLGLANQDLVRGKGSGLFILLHGVPGVGKTATAEAVAQANNKPLFTITCGDLGLTPDTGEMKLNEVFQLAHLWDCVLLLDEADIFLAKRDTFNLKRNALVSVFLRVLEYYSGILFLTTNRVGIIDEAFKSRIHISLYYEPLSRQQTIEIFRVNIRKLRGMEDTKEKLLGGDQKEQQQHPRLRIKATSIIDYAGQHYDMYEDAPHLRWNGRQIRNAFQIASSLAHYNIRSRGSISQPNLADTTAGGASDEPVAYPVLDAKQFDKVAEAVERFGQYLDETKAKTDADQARIENVRADHVRNENFKPLRSQHASPFGQPVTPSPTTSRRSAGGLQQQQQQQRRVPNYGVSPPPQAAIDAGGARGQGRGRSSAQPAPMQKPGQLHGTGPGIRESLPPSMPARTRPQAQPQYRSPAPGRVQQQQQQQQGQAAGRRTTQHPPPLQHDLNDDYNDEILDPAGADPGNYGAYEEEGSAQGYEEDYDDEVPEAQAAQAGGAGVEDYDD
ncbi:AAA family [Colletotrichum sojae]|uniref:AAA family n=1 Tax=Colletotrichum sojae TaxID=2175907 RepID=A0A8H6JKN5_9PEZI|nr:AAA family [Colletotrichum sojae]